MKYILLILACALVFVLSAAGQKPADAPSDRFNLGGRTVIVPAPEGFANGLRLIERFSAIANATEGADLDTLAAHVPISSLLDLMSGAAALDLYTKVSVAKKARSIDLTPAQFNGVVATVQKNFSSYIDPKNPSFKKTIETASTRLKERLGTETSLELSQPQNLGFFDKKPGVFSGMLMMSVHVNDVSQTMLGSVSYVLVNKRLIYVYGFKPLKSDEDVTTLQNFIKKWTAAIIAANRPTALARKHGK